MEFAKTVTDSEAKTPPDASGSAEVVEKPEAKTERAVERGASADSSPGVRHLVDFVVTLTLWVVLVRAFAVEGYIVSTGSMAPHLLGYHKRVVCPSCGMTFAVGVRVDGANAAPRWAVCPNCNQSAIDISQLPVNTGDQLLVHKHAYLFGEPRRWDVVVFRNPERPTQAYVKRLVGLPGERVQIREGDIYVDGRIARKNLLQQHATRILVYDADHCPHPAPDWQPRWIADPGWTRLGSCFVSQLAATEGQPPTYHWLKYRHWIRSGGSHWTAVRVRPWPKDVPRQCPDWPQLRRVDFAPQAGLIRCRGVLSAEAERRLIALSGSGLWRQAVRQLADRSHVAPIDDVYAYDDPSVLSRANIVRDLMIECRVRPLGGHGRLVFRMLDGRHVYDCVLDWGKRQVQLFWDGKNSVVAESALPAGANEPFIFEMSTFDRQVLAAVNGRELFCVPVPEIDQETSRAAQPAFRNERFALSHPVHIAVRQLSVKLEGVRLYRDIYYTVDRAHRATNQPYQLGPDEYFFLGDNSPVSLDSRSWSDPVVRRHMFLGKPLVLHLPSRPMRIHLGRWERYIRVPDFTRIRYIR